MNRLNHRRWVMCAESVAAVLVFFAVLGNGCSRREPLKPGAQEFRKEVEEIFKGFSPLVMDPVSKGERKAAEATLEEFASDHFQKVKVSPLGIGLLDKDGVLLARWTSSGSSDSAVNFADYRSFKKTIQDGIITQEKLFYQDGRVILIVCAPVFREKQTKGLVTLAFSLSDLKEKLGLTVECLAMNFNS
jgi:hypothetical protein